MVAQGYMYMRFSWDPWVCLFICGAPKGLRSKARVTPSKQALKC